MSKTKKKLRVSTDETEHDTKVINISWAATPIDFSAASLRITRNGKFFRVVVDSTDGSDLIVHPRANNVIELEIEEK